MAESKALTYLRQQRMVLLDEAPFFGYVLMSLEFVEDGNQPTVWTDGKRLGFNPGFVLGLPPRELRAALAHEVLHVTHDNCTAERRNGRDRRRWNIATDYVNNLILVASGFKLPEGGLYDPQYRGLLAEQVYERLPKQQQQGGSGQGNQQGAGQPQPQSGGHQHGAGCPCGGIRELPAGAEADQKAQVKVTVANAVNAAQVAGKMPADLLRVIRAQQFPETGWAEQLRHLCELAAADDYDWQRPNPRHMHRGIYMPSLRNPSCNFVVAFDTSGSIDDATLATYRARTLELLATLAPRSVALLYCDAKLQGQELLEAGDAPTFAPCKGGGGTNFRPVFDWVEREAEQVPNAVIYFTDLAGYYPEQDPGYPVIWATLPNPGRQPPWGDVVEVTP